MKDFDIRVALHEKKMRNYKKDPNTLVVDELGLCQGDARIDIAVINGKLHGYEIKSEKDTLDRLPWQCDIYSRVLDTVTMVANDNHIEKIIQIIPEWWGILRVRSLKNEIVFSILRKCKANPSVDSFSLAQLLWRNEAFSILDDHDMAKGLKSKPRNVLWKVLAESFPLTQLKSIVRQTIKERGNWRAAQQQKQGDDLLQP